jgi:hypothetical protein
MESIDVKGLPEPIVRGLEIVAQMARNLLEKPETTNGHEQVQLGVRKGTVYGKLTREEIYDDVV